MRTFALAAMVWLGLSGAALCDSPKPEPLPAAVAVQAYGDKHPECVEWSDGCVACARGGKCSTPGIACQPSEILCKKAAK